MAAVLQVMQEVWGYDKSVTWVGAGLGGGMSGLGSLCGNVAGAAAAYGLRAGQAAGEDKAAAKAARKKSEDFARRFGRDFTARFGHTDCRALIPYDLSTPEGSKAYYESGIWRDRCYKYAEYAVRTLFEQDPLRQAE